MYRAGAAGIGVCPLFKSRCRTAEQRDRVPAPRVAERRVGQIAGREPSDAAPTCLRKHPGSVSQVVYSDS